VQKETCCTPVIGRTPFIRTIQCPCGINIASDLSSHPCYSTACAALAAVSWTASAAFSAVSLADLALSFPSVPVSVSVAVGSFSFPLSDPFFRNSDMKLLRKLCTQQNRGRGLKSHKSPGERRGVHKRLKGSRYALTATNFAWCVGPYEPLEPSHARYAATTTRMYSVAQKSTDLVRISRGVQRSQVKHAFQMAAHEQAAVQ
jgi:hypothetical protein